MTNLQPRFTYEDFKAGACLEWQIDTPKPQVLAPEVDDSSPPLVPPANAKEVVQEYLEAYNEIGGRAALVKQAKLNPMKFYDQLLKVLMAMEAPKAAVAVQVNIEQMKNEEIVSLSSAELKKLLMERD